MHVGTCPRYVQLLAANTLALHSSLTEPAPAPPRGADATKLAGFGLGHGRTTWPPTLLKGGLWLSLAEADAVGVLQVFDETVFTIDY